MKKKSILLYYLALIVFVLLYWFVTLIPLNFRDPRFFFHFIVLIFLILVPFLGLKIMDAGRWKAYVDQAKQNHITPPQRPAGSASAKEVFARFRSRLGAKKLFFIPLILLGVYVVLLLTGASVFQSKNYARLINRVEGEFQEDIAEIDFYDIPTVDRDTAMRLGNKKMGEMAELVSQFDVADDYIQINFRGRPVRVTPLEYADLIKWFNNRGDGLPSLVRVDLISSEVELEQIPGGMKYSESEPLFRNINRHLRFQYPTAILGQPMFEIDDAAVPYWITPVLAPKVGWFSGLDVKDVILTNAITGVSERMPVEECPTWVDRVYPSDLILNQLTDNGRFQSGWLNSIFGQRGVLQTTSGYNYLAIRDDVYLYTGLTSVAKDSSNLGFVLVNQRTKETKFYPVSSADEMSAMGSAQGAVQEKQYISTFPILLNIEGRPTYCMALKDNAQLVKMYALVDAQSYQATATGFSIREAIANYKIRLAAQLRSEPEMGGETPETVSKSGTIAEIKDVVIEGNTVYYLVLEETAGEEVFSAAISVSEQLPFLKAGDKIELAYRASAFGGIQAVETITRK